MIQTNPTLDKISEDPETGRRGQKGLNLICGIRLRLKRQQAEGQDGTTAEGRYACGHGSNLPMYQRRRPNFLLKFSPF